MYGLPLRCKSHFEAMANTVAVMYPACLWNPLVPGLDGIRAHRSS